MSLDDEDRQLLRNVEDSGGRLERRLDRTEKQFRRKFFRANAAVTIAIVAAVLAACFAWVAWDVSNRVDEEADARATATAEARVSACIQSNVALDAIREALPSVLLGAIPNPQGLTDEQLLATLQPSQRESLERIRAKTKDRLRFRDCSLEGIGEYLTDPPSDPATTTTR